MFIFSSDSICHLNKKKKKKWISIKRNLLTFENFAAYLVHHSHQFSPGLE